MIVIEESRKVMTIVSNNIRLLAKHKGIKISEIEEAAGYSHGYFARQVTENKSASAFYPVYVAAKALNVSIDYLCTEDIEHDIMVEELTEKANRLGYRLVSIENDDVN